MLGAALYEERRLGLLAELIELPEDTEGLRAGLSVVVEIDQRTAPEGTKVAEALQ